ncbi:nuclear transport factor 2 family protein [Neptuniibacter halophilus]|uniref:nuclear transport factor 2 family protein n=1 Tax=Neptuniibacter halophilus TaxID=651666 RepID=UPI0025732249|nr:nuclear transport factor 2 family protein [Neptuniibacter halophilus]
MNPRNLNDLDTVISLVQDYFSGLHYAEVTKLDAVFHPDAVLKAPGLRRTKKAWLEKVSNREIPAELNMPFDYRILSVDLLNEQAMVKVYCPLPGRQYIDFLGLLKEQGRWMIVNKMYADA